MKKYAVVTGAGSGIGKATAKYFASKGLNLIVVDINEENLVELKEEINDPVDIQIRVCDLSKEDQVFDLYQKTKEYDLEIWMNNAGLGNMCPLLETDIKKALVLNRVNVDATAILTLLFAKDYQDKEATLINVSSWNGYSITQGNPVYSATKFYTSALSEALYWELKTNNKPLKVKIICPAFTKTNFIAASSVVDQSNQDIDYDKVYGGGNTPEEIAKFIYEMYQSDELIGYVDGTDYSFHKVGPKLPDTHNKKDLPNLLTR